MAASVDLNFYFSRFGFSGPLIAAKPSSELKMVVVIPCHDEPGLLGTLESLRKCDPPSAALEIIVVINGSAKDSVSARQQNQSSIAESRASEEAHSKEKWKVHILDFLDLPSKHAGVGLARKIGMDEALRRFERVQQLESAVLVCLDADCEVEVNYLSSWKTFLNNIPPRPDAAFILSIPSRVIWGRTYMKR